ncbi:MAG: single-stranded-DNA-specific exonuclease [Methanothermococcus sp.]|nr:single-stranded-DNA-specific exonuclease [Methanothermococcus sp.]MDK2988312.1 single-stranded-DNA-specific exonuclease [Methanothermococcus sp.]
MSLTIIGDIVVDILPIDDFANVNNIYTKIKEKIENYDGVIRVITHHDTDGLTSGAIVVDTLYRQNKNFHLSVVENLSNEVIEKLSEEDEYGLYIFCDMGSGQIDELLSKNFNAIILDHHPPLRKEYEIKNILQLNPHLFGVNGAKELSASGVCYLVAREFGYYDLSVLAITGAIGDMQHKPFTGLNKFILNEGRRYRHIKSILKDIVFNCYDLPIWKSILYSTQPYIGELNGRDKILEFLNKIDIDPEKIELSGDEEQRLISALMKYVNKEDIVVDRYIIDHKINDAFYLSEILNACGRTGMTSIGIGVALEDEECIKTAKEIYEKYKGELIEELKEVEIKSLNNIEYFFGKKGTTGLIASLMVKDKPVLGIYEEGEFYKISSRGNNYLVNNGLNLSEAMGIAKEFGGNGGGHNVASGASIPKEHLNEFLKKVDELVGTQMKNND